MCVRATLLLQPDFGVFLRWMWLVLRGMQVQVTCNTDFQYCNTAPLLMQPFFPCPAASCLVQIATKAPGTRQNPAAAPAAS